MDVGDVSGYQYTWDAATAVTVAVDLWEIVMVAGQTQRVGGISLSQSTELGDAQHEILNFAYVWGNTTSGSGGGTPTETHTGVRSSGSVGVDTVECRNTTQATGGTGTVQRMHGWNVLSPLDIWYPNGLEPRTLPSDGGGELNAIRLLASPADSITMHSTLVFRAGVVNF